ncbi:MAG: protein phosphatase 2C domain-containing protein [Tannerellaceae bacterium]|jgi:protein phosphatase|nr:protein phosphatase 2C domain-containing protein [Tannerellaceae bacterium]
MNNKLAIMNIMIGKPYAVSEKGCKFNNEDSIYPSPEAVSSNQKLFLVCDGVGGREKGEIASSMMCDYFSAYFSSMLTEENPSTEFIQKAIQYTEAHFDTYVAEHPEALGMATTLAMLYVGTNGITLAHIGDSRIYQFRNGEIVCQTEDHSLVNSLVKMGSITPQEAYKHPKKNVILRAIQGIDKHTEADVALIQDVQPGDYFFMCTDGVLENLTNEKLASIFKGQTTAEVTKDTLMESCDGKTNDNFSFYIIPIQNIQDSIGYRQNLLSFLYSFI